MNKYAVQLNDYKLEEINADSCYITPQGDLTFNTNGVPMQYGNEGMAYIQYADPFVPVGMVAAYNRAQWISFKIVMPTEGSE